ncbi:MAG: type VI secretion system baseplate subunit TssF, partial [Acetobacteraceae bacterium]
PMAEGAKAVLRITLACATPEATFSALGVDRLRFFLRGGAAVALSLYELLVGQTISVAFADGPADANPVIAPASSIAAVGFAPDEALLPWPARSFAGFRLLSELFAFPEKFLFIDITGIEAKTLVAAGKRLEIFVYLSRAVAELERAVGPESLALGASPIVNLFPQRCEPLALTETDTEYRLVADARRQAGLEIYAVERVRETRADGSSRPWHPFYRLSPTGTEDEEPAGFYHPVRRAGAPATGGSEVFIEPFETGAVVSRPADAVLSVDALCLNRDLPADLPFGGGHPRLSLVTGAAALASVNCLSAPTPTLRPPLRERGFWRLVSHLSLGHLSVVGGEQGAHALKEVLRLYDLRDSAETRAAIEGLVGVSAQAGVARLPGGRLGAFCRGLDVTLEFDARSWQAAGPYLMASVLERFLALHASVNSFVRTRAILRGRTGTAASWPARAGARVLL